MLLNNVDISSLEQSLLENLPPELDLPSTKDWQSFWNQVEIILQSQSLDDMTWFCSAVQQACGYLDADPATPDCAAALAALLREAVMVRVAGVYHRAAEE